MAQGVPAHTYTQGLKDAGAKNTKHQAATRSGAKYLYTTTHTYTHTHTHTRTHVRTPQDLKDADAKNTKPGGDKEWRKNFVRAMNHVAQKRAQLAARGGDDDDMVSMAGMSVGRGSVMTK